MGNRHSEPKALFIGNVMRVGIAVLGFLILVCAGFLSAGIMSSEPVSHDEQAKGSTSVHTTVTPTTADIYSLE